MRYLRIHIVLLWLGLISGLLSHASVPGPEASHEKIDSLLKILPVSSEEEKTELLFTLSRLYLSISMDSSREYAKLALESARKTNNSIAIAEAYKLLGNISYYKGEFNEVIRFYDSSLMEYKVVNDSFGQSKVLNNMGIIYQHIGDYKKSIDFHLKSLEFKKSLGDSVGIANSYNNIGSLYYDLRNYEKSSEYFKLALDMSENLGNISSVQGILNNLGLINQDIGNIEKSNEYFQRSIEIGEQTGDLKVVATSYHNYGKSLFLTKKYTESLASYNKALDIYNQLGIKNSQTLNNIGQLYLELDYYQKALQYLKKALQYAEEHSQFKVLSDIYQNISVAYERMGNFEEAYYHYMAFHAYDDSLKNQIHSSQIEELITKNEIEKNREQLEKARLRIEKAESDMQRRNITIYSVVAGLLVTMVFALVILRLLKIKGKYNTLLQQQNDEIRRSQKTIKKINKALTESEATLRSIFGVSPFSIFVINGKGLIIGCNDTCLQMFRARNKRDLLEKNISTFVETEEIESPSQFLESIKNNRLGKEQYTIKRIDLSSFSAELIARLIYGGGEYDNTFIVVVTDITERLKFIESLKNAKQKAEESDTLKTAFLTNMSHEIRTPMNSIIGFANLLNDQNLNLQKREEYLSHILHSSGLLLNLIDDIIDISKIEAGQLSFNNEEFKLNEVLENWFQSYTEIITDKPIDFRLNLPEVKNEVYGYSDVMRLKQVLGNLMSNAVKFTREGHIELGYTINEESGDTRAVFYVEDTGIGIPDDKHDVIFERFRQVDDSRTRNFGGTGLGLAISKKLVEYMNGEIWVESAPGRGSTFYFTLPVLFKESEKTTNESTTDENKPRWAGKTLLVAEDENSNYELIKAILKPTGVKLIRARNGEEAISCVKQNPHINLILMDIRMPKINGYDATRKIKTINSRLPVLSITAYAMTEDESKSIEAGCDTYISKPIKPARLMEVLDRYLS